MTTQHTARPTAKAPKNSTTRRNAATGNTFVITEGGWSGWRATLGASCECGQWHEASCSISAPDIPLACFEAMLDDQLSVLLHDCGGACER